MAYFQSVMLVVAIIALIICLILIGMFLKDSKSSIAWPPIVPNCPDYWRDSSGDGSHCVNTHSLGSPVVATMDFTASQYKGSSGNCAKYTWATTNGLEWDGITYGVPNPCLKNK